MPLRCFAFACLCLSLHAATETAPLAAARALYHERKPVEAQAAFAALAAAEPKNAEAQFYLGRLALSRDEHEKAVAHLEKAVALTPANSSYHHRLGDAYGRSAQKASLFSQMGLAKKCRTAYEQAVALNPQNVDARLSLLGFYQQAPGIAGGSMDKAREQALAVKQLDATRGRQALAGLYLAEKKYPEAFAEYDEVLKQKPDDYGALYQLGRLTAVSGQQFPRGLAALRLCLTLTPPEGQPSHAAAHWRIGHILEQQGDKPAARTAYESALKVDPKFPQALEALKKL
jgi:tetratricopeptide (TPR) repeat protein